MNYYIKTVVGAILFFGMLLTTQSQNIKEKKISKIDSLEVDTPLNIKIEENNQIKHDSLELISVQEKDKELAIAHLNHTVTLIAKIKAFNNLSLLQDEFDEVINNLSIEGIVQFDEVSVLRQNMIKELQKFIINETEKQRLDKKNERKQGRLLKEAAASALSGTYVTLNPYSLIANVGLASLRAGLDMSIKKDLLAEELDDKKWNLTKSNLMGLSNLRSEYLDVSQKLFKQYGLKDNENLTERRSIMLADFLKTSNMELRLKKMLYDKTIFEHYAPYWYFLGDAYQETGDVNNAVKSYEMYKKLYKAAPIYRIDKKLGVVQLRLLKIRLDDGSISYEDAKLKMNEIRYNLPNDGGAYLSCAAILAENFGKYKEAMDLLQEAILKDNVSNKSTSALALILMAKENKNTNYNLNLAADAISEIKQIDIALLLMYYQETKRPSIENKLTDISLSIDRSKLWDSRDEFILKFNNNIFFDIDKMNLTSNKIELYFDDAELEEFKYSTTIMKIDEADGIKKDDLEDIVEKQGNGALFTDNENMMNLFFKEISDGLLIPIYFDFNDEEKYENFNPPNGVQISAVENCVNDFLNRKYYSLSFNSDYENESELRNENSRIRDDLYFYYDGSSSTNESVDEIIEIYKNKKDKGLLSTYNSYTAQGLVKKLYYEYRGKMDFPMIFNLNYGTYSYTFLSEDDEDDEDDLELIMIKNENKVLYFNESFKQIKVNDFIENNKNIYSDD